MGRIALNYLKSQFIIDCLANLPMIVTNYTQGYLYYFKLLRNLKMHKLFINVEQILKEITSRYSKITQNIIMKWFELIKFLVFVIFIMHLEACVFLYVGREF